MKKPLLWFLIAALALWVLVDAFYWCIGDHPNLFPHSRYFLLLSIGIAVALALSLLIFLFRKIVELITRRSN